MKNNTPKKITVFIIISLLFLSATGSVYSEIGIIPEISIGLSENFDDHIGAYDPDDRFFASMFGDAYVDFIFSSRIRSSIRYAFSRSTRWSEPLNVNDGFNPATNTIHI